MAPEVVFVTGGTGYVGQATLPRLVAAGHEVRALTRRADARTPAGVRPVVGDLSRPASYRDALRGCAALVHLAWAGDVDSSVRLVDDAIAAGVRGVIHVSTTAVYGAVAAAEVDETTPYGPAATEYARAKRAIEAALLARSGALDLVVLQPANVYGGRGGWWSGAMVDLMRRGRVLVLGGTANLVHVEDVARAVALALDRRSELRGERILLTDGRPIPWTTYFAALEQVVGHPATLHVGADEAKRLSRRLRDRGLLARGRRWLRRRLTGERVLFPLDDEAIEGLSARRTFQVEKARRLLGFEPEYDLARGIATLGCGR